ncbi:hypothetical protein DLAC_11283 [Tieghemostelium lacteum]|uniref:VLRF1 domain-containing protein n=1 Tax=Tieghemostelium lacteum TaxID=361077 RepID=A0A151Z427_TIELA|nr:hypothetical protein DLAC_11283 [Tieghemostelium lacteum]|eukprot:KYQ88554.1 hypothetical protein DLAC_11283 [Tieghemostelium lacteum]
MKRIPIFQLSNSTIITKNFPLDIQINGDTYSQVDTIKEDETLTNTTTTTTTTTSTNSSNNSNNSTNNKFEHKCNTCIITFNDPTSRNEHYRSGIHRYNLKLKLSHLPIVNEEEYRNLVNGGGNSNTKEEDSDESDESSDDSSSSSDETDSNIIHEQQGYQFTDTAIEFNDPKVRIISKELKLQVSVWKCILANTETFKLLYQYRSNQQYQAQKGAVLIEAFKSIVKSSGDTMKWAVLMCSGGRFAGSINQIGKCLEHKAFHRYTTRKKQGGSQSSKDSQGATKHSAGAGLRRYNEKRLKEEVAELLQSWKSQLEQCTFIFVFAPKGNTRDILFPQGGVISHLDERIRNIPFPIIRPTYNETQRVSSILFSVDIELFDEEKEELRQKELQEKQKQLEEQQEKERIDQEAKLQKQQQLMKDVSQYRDDRLFQAIRNKDMEKVRYLLETDESYELPEPKQGDSILTPLYLAMEAKDMEMMKYFIQMFPMDLNILVPDCQFGTVLHRASELGNLEMIELLLNSNADPTVSEGLKNQTAYDCAANQKTRDFFREWAGTHLNKWDYQKAHLVPLTPQQKQEQADKKKLKRKAQKEKEKVKKQQEKVELEEQKKRDLEKQQKQEELKVIEQIQMTKIMQESKLTDREKRALAAESRSNPLLAKKCDNCNQNIPGVPFERLTYKYCSVACVKSHKQLFP